MIGERLARSWQRRPLPRLHYDASGRLGQSHKSFLSAEPAYAAGVCFRNCAVNHPDFSDVGPQRTHLETARVFGSPYADPILLVDPNVALGRGLRHQLTRYGFCADLAITLEAARASVEHKYYHAIVVITDPSNSQSLFELRQLRDGAPRTWIIVLAIKTADPASDPMLDFGADAWLLIPFRFSDLLFHLESFAHRERAA
jgi:hypothetical protein